jgi:hypothetical protein
METPDDGVEAECFRTAKHVKLCLDRITYGGNGRYLIAVHDSYQRPTIRSAFHSCFKIRARMRMRSGRNKGLARQSMKR